MITLFRRIRERLIASGSISKYLIYAVGEILLVVIGILIALQVNNWNEERKNEAEEYFILTKLQQSLIQDLETFEQVVQSIDEASADLEIIEEQLYDSSRTHFTIDLTSPLVSTFRRSLERATWDNLISTGKISLISNQTIADSLFNYYHSYDDGPELWNEATTQYTRNIIAPFILDFDDISYGALIEENSQFLPKRPITEYRSETMFRNIVRFKRSAITGVKNSYEESKIQAESILRMINSELEP